MLPAKVSTIDPRRRTAAATNWRGGFSAKALETWSRRRFGQFPTDHGRPVARRVLQATISNRGLHFADGHPDPHDFISAPLSIGLDCCQQREMFPVRSTFSRSVFRLADERKPIIKIASRKFPQRESHGADSTSSPWLRQRPNAAASEWRGGFSAARLWKLVDLGLEQSPRIHLAVRHKCPTGSPAECFAL